MEYLTSEQIADSAENRFSRMRAIRTEINRLFRAQDDSHLYPINGRFNATERAIRRTNKFERVNGELSPLEYAYFIDSEISRIVNREA